MATAEEKANAAYTEIGNNASSNKWLQGLTGILGFPFTTIVDVGVLFTHYGPMFNNIRGIYGRERVEIQTAGVLTKNIAQEVIVDLVSDKLLGNVPVVGIYFNVVCAKAMSWRLGILFSMLSARGEEINQNTVSDAVFVIRKMFPKGAMGFDPPNRTEFIKLIVSSTDKSDAEFKDKIQRAKEIFS